MLLVLFLHLSPNENYIPILKDLLNYHLLIKDDKSNLDPQPMLIATLLMITFQPLGLLLIWVIIFFHFNFVSFLTLCNMDKSYEVVVCYLQVPGCKFLPPQHGFDALDPYFFVFFSCKILKVSLLGMFYLVKWIKDNI